MCRALVTFPHIFTTVSGVVEVLERVDGLKVCPGNADEKFSSLRSLAIYDSTMCTILSMLAIWKSRANKRRKAGPGPGN